MSTIWTPEREHVVPGKIRVPLIIRERERVQPQASYGLVGSRGTAVVGTLNNSITPTFAQATTAGSLLILWVSGSGGTTSPAAPGTWTLAAQANGGAQSNSSSIFFKIAAGSDANPTVAGVASVLLMGAVAEFSGGSTTAPLDQIPTGAVGAQGPRGTTSTQTATCAAADAQPGELVIACSATRFSAAQQNAAGAHTLNNGATASSLNNNVTSSANHYFFTYGITTGNSGASSCIYAFTTTNISGSSTTIATFLLPDLGGGRLPLLLTNQAVMRAATR